MRRILLVGVAMLVAGALAATARAEDKKPDAPKRTGLVRIFKHLDANDDGQLSTDEVPQRMVERHKEALKKADKNDDKKLSPAEFGALAKHLRPAGPPPWGRHGRRPKMGRGPAGPPPACRWQGRCDGRFPGGFHGPRPRPYPGPPMMGRHGPRGPSMAGPPRRPCPEEIFKRLDRNDDKALSLEEFKAGMRRLHAKLRAHRARGHFGPAMHGRRAAAMKGRVLCAAKKGKEIFKKADKNDDGKVSLDEVPAERQDRFKKLLAKADKDGDKALSAAEGKRAFFAVMHRARAKHAAKHRAARFRMAAIKRFKAADKNDDGKLSRDEAPERLKEHFSKIDADGDGQLTPAELKKAWEAKREEIKKKIAQRKAASAKKAKAEKAKPAKPKGQKPAAKKPDKKSDE
jgi:Ca2+-binding EF-hand superfamily protein